MCTDQFAGFSGADMASLCREAAYGPVREAAASIQHISVEEVSEVTFSRKQSGMSLCGGQEGSPMLHSAHDHWASIRQVIKYCCPYIQNSIFKDDFLLSFKQLFHNNM